MTFFKNSLIFLAAAGVALLGGCQSQKHYGVTGDDPFGFTVPTDRTVSSGGTTTHTQTSGGFNFITGGTTTGGSKNIP